MSERPPLASLDDHLRTPRGQLHLIAAGYGLAAVVAVVMVANRPWFEAKRNENVTAPGTEIAALASELDAGAATARDVAALRPYERPLLYDAWLTNAGLKGAGLPRALAEAAPAEARARVERTLVAGSPEQRARAIELARLSGHPELRAALEWARDRALRLRDAALERALDDALVGGAPGGG